MENAAEAIAQAITRVDMGGATILTSPEVGACIRWPGAPHGNLKTLYLDSIPGLDHPNADGVLAAAMDATPRTEFGSVSATGVAFTGTRLFGLDTKRLTLVNCDFFSMPPPSFVSRLMASVPRCPETGNWLVERLSLRDVGGMHSVDVAHLAHEIREGTLPALCYLNVYVHDEDAHITASAIEMMEAVCARTRVRSFALGSYGAIGEEAAYALGRLLRRSPAVTLVKFYGDGVGEWPPAAFAVVVDAVASGSPTRLTMPRVGNARKAQLAAAAVASLRSRVLVFAGAFVPGKAVGRKNAARGLVRRDGDNAILHRVLWFLVGGGD